MCYAGQAPAGAGAQSLPEQFQRHGGGLSGLADPEATARLVAAPLLQIAATGSSAAGSGGVLERGGWPWRACSGRGARPRQEVSTGVGGASARVQWLHAAREDDGGPGARARPRQAQMMYDGARGRQTVQHGKRMWRGRPHSAKSRSRLDATHARARRTGAGGRLGGGSTRRLYCSIVSACMAPLAGRRLGQAASCSVLRCRWVCCGDARGFSCRRAVLEGWGAALATQSWLGCTPLRCGAGAGLAVLQDIAEEEERWAKDCMAQPGSGHGARQGGSKMQHGGPKQGRAALSSGRSARPARAAGC